MLQKLVDNRPKIVAATLTESLCESISEPYVLHRHVIEGDLDLHFTHIARCIEIDHCEFTGKIDIRNAVFDSTVLFRNCLFKGDVNAGDEELTHTLFKADLCFDSSVFHGFVSFIGFHCEASTSFRHCTFDQIAVRDSELMGPRRPVEFIGGKVIKAFSVNRSVFKGGVSFNGLRCDFAGFFQDVRFESNDKLTIDFVASSYGVGCVLDGAIFEGNSDFGSISCGDAGFSARGTVFVGYANFFGLHCTSGVSFEPYYINFDYQSDELWSSGEIPLQLRREIERFVPLPISAQLNLEDGIWTLQFFDIPTRWLLYRKDYEIFVKIPSTFVGPFSIAYAEIGLNLSLFEAVVKAKADFNNLLCKGDVFLSAATFEGDVDFISCHLHGLYAYGSDFAGKTNFASFACYEARFDPYEIEIESETYDQIAKGTLTVELRSIVAQYGFNISERSSLSFQNDRWLLLDENDMQRAYIDLLQENKTLYIISRFFGEELTFDHGQVGWYISLNGAFVRSKTSFNATHCIAGGFFRNTLFVFDKPISLEYGYGVDFRYGRYGINLQMEGMQAKSKVTFEGVSINNDLIIDDKTVFYEAVNFTGARIGRLRFKNIVSYVNINPFRKQQLVFTGCTFDFFEGPWRMVVDQQDPSHFSLDLYLVLERCARAAGRQAEADEIYYEGRSRETQHALKDLRLASFFKGALWHVLVGYGVRQFKLGIWCTFFIALGVLVFWTDDALLPANKAGDAVPAYASQHMQSPSNLGANFGGICTGQLFGSSSAWVMSKLQRQLRLIGIDVSMDNRMLDRFVSRLAYSVDVFVPVDLEIADLCRPAPGWRQVYIVIHILAGWILIPLLIAAVTGFLGKR
jgi:hypothetical protein